MTLHKKMFPLLVSLRPILSRMIFTFFLLSLFVGPFMVVVFFFDDLMKHPINISLFFLFFFGESRVAFCCNVMMLHKSLKKASNRNGNSRAMPFNVHVLIFMILTHLTMSTFIFLMIHSWKLFCKPAKLLCDVINIARDNIFTGIGNCRHQTRNCHSITLITCD